MERKSHVPYLESQLTRLLQPALGGNARTTAVVTASAAAADGEQTLAALRFAEDCASITNRAALGGVCSLADAVRSVERALSACEANMANLRARVRDPRRARTAAGPDSPACQPPPPLLPAVGCV